MRERSASLLADFELKDSPSFVEAKPISKFCMEKFLTREVDKVSVLYTHFINTINQRTVVQTLLPISGFDLPKKHGESAEGTDEGVDPMLGIFLNQTQPQFSIRCCRIISPTRFSR
jgi:F-type H+-transporting ATPase subunit gamma